MDTDLDRLAHQHVGSIIDEESGGRHGPGVHGIEPSTADPPARVRQGPLEQVAVPPGVERVPLHEESLEPLGRWPGRGALGGHLKHGGSPVRPPPAGPGEALGPVLAGHGEPVGGLSVGQAEGESGRDHGQQAVGVEGEEPYAGPPVRPVHIRPHVDLAERPDSDQRRQAGEGAGQPELGHLERDESDPGGTIEGLRSETGRKQRRDHARIDRPMGPDDVAPRLDHGSPGCRLLASRSLHDESAGLGVPVGLLGSGDCIAPIEGVDGIEAPWTSQPGPAAAEIASLLFVVAAPDPELLIGGEGELETGQADRAAPADSLGVGDLMDGRPGHPDGKECRRFCIAARGRSAPLPFVELTPDPDDLAGIVPNRASDRPGVRNHVLLV